MEKAIRSFPEQLKFKPKIKNSLERKKKFIVSGMGGSHLAADLLKTYKPSLDLIVHHDYGLPKISGDLEDYLVIISSYSGNTEEALDGFNLAVKKNLSVACVSTGGELLELAEKYKKPYIKIPDTKIEPRSALGFSLVSLLKIMGERKAFLDIAKSAKNINMSNLRKKGMSLAKRLQGFIPIIYSSTLNESIAYNWKIRFNETGKIPSFCNSFPEINHNEMVGFDGGNKTKKLLKYFYFIFLRDEHDHPKVIVRMNILKDILKNKQFPVKILELNSNNFWEKVFSSLLLADWTSYFTAKNYGLEPEKTEIISEFKNKIKKSA